MSDLPTLAEIQDNFTLLDDWQEKYAYIIDLGRKLPKYPQESQDIAHQVPGCLSRVWMDYDWQGGVLNMRLMSDAEIVKGLLAVLTVIYSGKTPQEILSTDPKTLFEGLGLEAKLTQNRRDGFVAVATRIRQLAQAQV